MQAPSGSPTPYRPPRVDIYTVLLAIALVAVVIGCVFLFLEVQDYGSPPYPEGGVVLKCVPVEPSHLVTMLEGRPVGSAGHLVPC